MIVGLPLRIHLCRQPHRNRTYPLTRATFRTSDPPSSAALNRLEIWRSANDVVPWSLNPVLVVANV